MTIYTHTSQGRVWKLYGCAKRGCDAVNPDYMSFGAGDKGYCLHHIPRRYRLKVWWQDRYSEKTAEQTTDPARKRGSDD